MMRKIAMFLLMAVTLCGCTGETFETVDDESLQSVMQPQRQVNVATEDGAVLIDGIDGRLYLCDGYDISLQVFPSGDLGKTIKSLTGFDREDLTVVETKEQGMDRYTCVWASAGLYGDTAGRLVIFDDGIYHYTIAIMAAAEDAAALQPCWNQILESVTFS